MICTECSATLFPIINDKLCVANSTGQLVDEAGQAVDLALWQNHFTHCHERCPGTKGREFLARIDIVLMFSELDYAKKKIKGTGVGRWSDFKYSTGRVRSAIHYSAPTQPATGALAPPPSSGRPSSVESLAAAVDPRQTHPVALGTTLLCEPVQSIARPAVKVVAKLPVGSSVLLQACANSAYLSIFPAVPCTGRCSPSLTKSSTARARPLMLVRSHSAGHHHRHCLYPSPLF